MISYKTGDILKEEVEVLVNTVNCVGVMGRGIALQFKKAFPDNFEAYKKACDLDQVVPGQVWVHESSEMLFPKFIVNFPTKRHWRGKSRISDIEAGLESLLEFLTKKNIKSIAIPPLGSGLGGLEWNEVKALIESKLNSIKNIEIIVFEPYDNEQNRKMISNREVPEMTPGRAALIGLVKRYLDGLLDPFVTLLEVHKLMYFLQESGEKLKLRYTKGHYGPYAENLRHVLNSIEGHFLVGFADGGEDPSKKLNIVPGAHDEAIKLLSSVEKTTDRFNKVTDLVEGFESSFGLELLATTHWVVLKEKANNLNGIINKIYSWNSHKQKFTKRQIQIAFETLQDKQWLQ